MHVQCSYIASYVSKSLKGMSELLKAARNEARTGNATLKRQVRDIGNTCLNNGEISAQEAVYTGCIKCPKWKTTSNSDTI